MDDNEALAGDVVAAAQLFVATRTLRLADAVDAMRGALATLTERVETVGRDVEQLRRQLVIVAQEIRK